MDTNMQKELLGMNRLQMASGPTKKKCALLVEKAAQWLKEVNRSINLMLQMPKRRDENQPTIMECIGRIRTVRINVEMSNI